MGRTSSQVATIVNVKGLHARAAAKLSRLSATFDAVVTVHHQETSADTRSIMDLLLLVASKGCEVEIQASGPAAAEAVTAIASLIADGFGENDHPTASSGIDQTDPVKPDQN
ncbi:MAG: HPr family phosphocarrier protein [Pseudomonadota bacterium]